jgi:hypothetical protein
MTSRRSGLRLLRPDDGRFASWCGSCARARISPRQGYRLVLGPLRENQMRKISLVAAITAIALMLAGVGVWATSTIQARIDVPASAQIDPLQITKAQGTCQMPIMTITPWCSRNAPPSDGRRARDYSILPTTRTAEYYDCSAISLLRNPHVTRCRQFRSCRSQPADGDLVGTEVTRLGTVPLRHDGAKHL